MTRYLADTSIWAWAAKGSRPDIREKLAERIERGELATCVPVILEVMHSPRTGDAYDGLYEELFACIQRLPFDDEVAEQALLVQRELAQGAHGNHMRPAVGYLIAATAELAAEDVVLWAIDRDMRVIAEHTGQPFEGEQGEPPE